VASATDVDDAIGDAEWFSVVARSSGPDAAREDPAGLVAGDPAARAEVIVSRLNPEQARAVTTTEGPLLILAGGLALLEAAVRIRQHVMYGRSGSFYEFETDPASGLRVPKPGITRGRDHVIEVNSLGFRGPELPMPKPP